MPKFSFKKPFPPFYREGLTFSCKPGCSRCCGGSPGYVWLEEEDIDIISRHIGLSREMFLSIYTLSIDGRVTLRDLPEDNWNCVMLKEGLCSIYEVRPMQCRTFPFWSSNLRSKSDWEAAGKGCPGIGEGREYTREEIEAIRDERETIDSLR